MVLNLQLMIGVIVLSHSPAAACQLYRAATVVVQVLLTALDALAPPNLPHVVACYGGVDTPAVVNGIGQFTQQFMLLQEMIL